VLPQEVVTAALESLSRSPGTTIAVDLPEQLVQLMDGSIHPFEVDPFAKQCLVNGVDELGYTLAQLPEIDAFEARRGDR
jgi:3-isopropylmalate/(R)-2-methylmalate dehydratase small subunit